MNDKELETLMKQAVMDSVIEVTCPNCDCTIRCEPDAIESYCYGCDKVVSDINPLVKLGLI
jgi:hypothetical protein